MGSGDVTGYSWANGADVLESGPGLLSVSSSLRGSLRSSSGSGTGQGLAVRPPQLWVRALQSAQSEEPMDGQPSLEEDTERHMRQMTQNGAEKPQEDAIPQFFKQKEAEALLDQRELEQLWGCLRENRTPPDDLTGERVSMAQSRIDMCLLDSDVDGSLLPQEMEAYIAQLVPNLRLLQFMDPSFLSLYCRIAARKFLFFCDPQRRGKLLIREILLSPVLSELMELRQEGCSEEEVAANWFSLEHTKAVYHEFLGLDVDHSGALSKEEVGRMSNESLTDLFIERVFDEQVRRSRGERGDRREMDLGCFLELLLALENKQTREGLAYIFRCLDLRGNGYLTAADIYTMFRSVHRRWMEGGNYELVIEDVKDEIFDMVKPQDPLRITLEDLLQCGQGHTVAAMLIDIAAFWAHDNRETLAAQADSDNVLPV